MVLPGPHRWPPRTPSLGFTLKQCSKGVKSGWRRRTLLLYILRSINIWYLFSNYMYNAVTFESGPLYCTAPRYCFHKKYNTLFKINTCTCKYLLCRYSHLFPAMLLCKSVKQAAACLKNSTCHESGGIAKGVGNSPGPLGGRGTPLKDSWFTGPWPQQQQQQQQNAKLQKQCRGTEFSLCRRFWSWDERMKGAGRQKTIFVFLFWIWWQENWEVRHKGTWKGGGRVCHTLSAWPFAARLTSNPIVCTGRWERQIWYDYVITTEGDGARLLAGVSPMWGVVAADSGIIIWGSECCLPLQEKAIEVWKQTCMIAWLKTNNSQNSLRSH